MDVSKTSLRRPVMTGLEFFSLFFLFLKVYNNLYNKTEQDKINLKNNFLFDFVVDSVSLKLE